MILALLMTKFYLLLNFSRDSSEGGGGGGAAAVQMIFLSFERASAKFKCCCLVKSDLMTRNPSLLIWFFCCWINKFQ